MQPPNPYAPPAAPISPPPTFQAGGPGPWQIGDTLNASWKAFANAWAPLVFAPILIGLVMALPIFVIMGIWIAPALGDIRMLQAQLQDPMLNTIILGWNLISVPAYAFLQPGIVKMRLCAVRNEPVQFGDLFSGGPHFLPMLWLQALMSGPGIFMTALGVAGRYAGVMALVSLSGFLANVVLFALLVFQALGLAFAEYFIVDRNQGVMESLKNAWALPGGDRGSVLGYFVIVGLIAVGGMMCCALPGLVTMPYAGVCAAMLFTRLAPAR